MFEGILKFYGFEVEQIEYMINRNYQTDSEEAPISPEFLFKVAFCETNPLKFNIIMGVRIGYSDNNMPFRVEAILRGYFELKEEEKDMDDVEVFFMRNGSAILFPYLRSLITDITSKSRHNPLVLPTLNFYQLLDDNDFEEYMLTEKHYREYNSN